ncbi:MAG: hypothetical protein KBE65_21320 [Phycisphaerae bacterium]|nr:hypothetical protein [Phycisphaerae bacterium]
MVVRLWRMLPFLGVLWASAVWVETGRAATEGGIRYSRQVAEIRFGVVEPPVVAQHDITVRMPVSNQQLEEKALECSGLAWVPGHLLISSDRHEHIVFDCPIDLKSMTLGDPVSHVVVRNEQQLLEDAEAITAIRDRDGRLAVYMMSSLSNDPLERPLPKRRHMLCFEISGVSPLTPQRPVVLSVATLRDTINGYLKTVGIDPYRTFNPQAPGPDQNTYRWGNVEGMSFTPDGSLLLGMRNPLCGESALFVVVQGVPEAFDAADPGRMRIEDLFVLDLGDRGVSDLCWDPLTQGYLIAAARSSGPRLNKDQPFPPNTLDSALFWWSGRKAEPAILFARLPDMKVEALCRLGATRFIALGTDEGDVSEGRVLQQQSVIAIMYFAGVDLGDNRQPKP